MLERLEEEITEYKAEEFLRANDNASGNTLKVLKSLYDFAKTEEKGCESLSSFVSKVQVKKKSNRKKSSKYQLSRTELPLENLIVESFDADQVWEELQLQNALIYETLISSVSKILAHANHSQKPEEGDDESSDSDSENDNPIRPVYVDDKDMDPKGQIESETEDESDTEVDGAKSKTLKPQTVSYPKSEIDDRFFSLAQFDDYLEKIDAVLEREKQKREEQSESDDEEEEEEDSDEDEPDVFYAQYFGEGPINYEEEKKDTDSEKEEEDDNPEKSKNDSTSSKTVRFNLLDNEDDEEESDSDEDKDTELEKEIRKATNSATPTSKSKPEELPDNASSFEKRRRKIDEGIELMEQEALEPKAWQFQGEVTADKRPENSLLEEHLIFDHLIRAAPEITAEVTLRLEDIIKQRIKDQAWDDVIRKVKPIENPVEYKRRLALDSEKSRIGLANIYEQEYIKQKKLEEGQDEAEAIPEEQIQIEKDLKALFSKLDALTNFHYTPKPPAAEIRVVTNIPSINIEEVAPISVSDATLLAPQEILDPSVAEIRSRSERTDTDKKRERRVKKKKQHVKRLAREEKARAKGITLQHVEYADKKLKKSAASKAKTGEDEAFQRTKELKSSKAFFSKLQQEAQSQIKDTLVGKLKRKKDTSQLVAKKFKL